jgi:hypothetical protein
MRRPEEFYFHIRIEGGSEAVYNLVSFLVGPVFGSSHDITVSGKCNANASSSTSFGGAHTDATGLSRTMFSICSKYVKVREIEIFEITD